MGNIIDEQTKYDLSKPIVKPVAKPNVFQPKIRTDYRSQQMGTNVPVSTTQPTTNTTTSSELQGVALPSNEELNKVKANTTDANVDKMAVQNERGQVEVENQAQQNTQFAPNTQYANGLAEGDVNKTQVAQDRGNAEVAQAQNVFAQSSTPQGTQTKPVEYNTAPVQQGDSSYTPQQPLTYADFRDAMYGPEAEREKRANRQAKIQAVGDALRHIGNLATTIGSDKMGRAIPQQFKTSPAQQTLAEYKAERKERDAMGYQQLLQHQKQKQQEYENALKQQQLAYDWADKDRDYQLKVGDFKLKVAKDGRDAAEAEQKLKNMLAQHDYYVAQGDYEKARAVKAQIEAEWEPQQQQAELNHKKAQTAASYASARNSNASASLSKAKEDELRSTAKSRNNFTIPTKNNQKVWSIPKSQYGVLGKALAGEAAKNEEWGKDLKERYEDKKLTSEDWLIEAYKHLDDDKIQQLLAKYGKLEDAPTGSFDVHSSD